MITGQQYVGKGYTDKYGFCPRWYGHMRIPSKPSHIQLAIQKHGAENFRAEWICTKLSENDAFAREEQEVNARNSLINGYNRALGGRGGKGIPITLETRQKMSASRMGHVVRLDTRDKLREAHLNRSQEEKLGTSVLLRSQKLGERNPAKRIDVRAKMKSSALARHAKTRTQCSAPNMLINLILIWTPRQRLKGRGSHWAMKRNMKSV